MDSATVPSESPAAAVAAGSVEAPTRTATPAPTPTKTKTSKPTPVVKVDTEIETEAIPFERVRREDPDMELGKEKVTRKGVEGVKSLIYDVTYTDGVETDRELVGEEVTSDPVDEVTSVGTYEPPEPEPEPAPQGQCDPNYSGACVPIDSDVDCAGGSGNGPSYVQGPVTVTGSDIYDLDRDGDGIGCDR